MSIFFDWKNKIDKDELNKVYIVLKNGGIVIFPTETVYGIGGNALDENAVKRIYEVKKRPMEKALSILIGSKEDIKKYAKITNELEQKIIDNFMPGPITLILKKKKNKNFNVFTNNNETIGVRIPDSKIIKEILDKCKFPIAAPSANISGKPSGVNMQEIKKDFDGKADILIDGGICKETKPSTIVKIEKDEIVILREGCISKEEIQAKIL